MEQHQKTHIGQVVGLILGVCCMFFVQQYFSRPPSIDKMLVAAVNEINKSCPMQVDELTRLDNAVALPDKTVAYNYTLAFEKDDVDAEALKQKMLPILINTAKTHPNFKLFRDNDVTLVYNYKDKNSLFLFKQTISPDMYK